MPVEESSGCRDESLDFAEPVAKRTRYASKKLLEPKKPEIVDTGSDELTILDVLNEDCWRIILDYVKLQDLVRSERVSRRWRLVVLRYLQGIRLRLTSNYGDMYESHVPLVNHRMLEVPPDRYEAAVKKFGRIIVAGVARSAAVFRTLSKYCPDIEDIGIYEPQRYNLKNKFVPFNKVRRISILDVNNFSDRHIAKFLGYTTMEELEVNANGRMTGACFSELKANLQSLEIQSCRALNFNKLASERLSELTKLEFSYNPLSSLENVYILLEKTPRLQYLGLVYYERTSKVGALVQAICGLSKLRHLNLFGNGSVTDQWLEAVGRSCGELRTVSIENCKGVTGQGIQALCCGAGRTLIALDVSDNDYITDEDLARVVSYCPKLEMLNVQYSVVVPCRLPRMAAALRRGAPRAKPLRLRVSRLSFKKTDDMTMESCADLIVDYDSNSFGCGDFQ